jgi:hypothetical protein
MRWRLRSAGLVATCTFCQYHGKSEIRWPEAPACVLTSLWPWNHETPNGELFRTDVEGGDVHVFASGFIIPPFDVDTQVTTTADCIRPVVAMDTRGRLHLTYTRLDGSNNPSVYRRWSDDNAESFSAETALGIANGKYATVATAPDGSLLVAALVYNSGTSGPGKIHIQYQGPGDTALSAEVIVTDDTATQLVFQDTTFHISAAHHGAAAWVLSALIDGETDTSEWQCWHEDEWSFKRVV